MRTLAPKACGGKLDLNFDLTTSIAMKASYASPNNANIRPCNFPLGTVYVCYTFSEVELCVLLSRNTLDLKEGSIGVGVTLAMFMTEYVP